MTYIYMYVHSNGPGLSTKLRQSAQQGDSPCFTMDHTLIYIIFLIVALRKAVSAYSAKNKAGNATEKILYSLGWSIDELSRLNETSQTTTY